MDTTEGHPEGTPEEHAFYDPIIKRLEMLSDETAEQMALADAIVKENPSLPVHTALAIAGDRLSVRQAEAALAEGRPFWKAAALVGSFSRLDWIVRQIVAGVIPESDVYPRLPAEWRGSDPDDTDSRFFWLWNRAWIANGKHTILDGDPLPQPEGNRRCIRVFRGQLEDAALGIAWTTDEDIARKFAHGAGTRQSNLPGVVYKAWVAPADVWAYLTLRHESEVIVNPLALRERPGRISR